MTEYFNIPVSPRKPLVIFALGIFVLILPYKIYYNAGVVTFSPSLLGLLVAGSVYLAATFPIFRIRNNTLSDVFLVYSFGVLTIYSSLGGVVDLTSGPVKLVLTVTLVLFLFSVTIRSSQERQYILRMYALSAVIVSLIAIVQSVFGNLMMLGRPLPPRTIASVTMPVGRSAGPFGTYGEFGMFISFIVPPLISSLVDTRDNHLFSSKRLDAVALGLILCSAFISQTRSVWVAIGLVVGVQLWYSFYGTDHPLLNLQTLLLAAPLLLLAGFFVARQTLDLSTLYLRFEVYGVAIDVLLDNLIFGVGYDEFLYHAPPQTQTVVHNIFLEALVTGGISSFFFLSVFFLRSSRRIIFSMVTTTEDYAPLTVGFVGVVFIAQLAPALWSIEFWLPLGILLSVHPRD